MSKKANRKRKSIYRYGLRNALFIAVISAVTLFLLCMFIIGLSWPQTLAISAAAFSIIAVTTYFTSYYFGYRRMKMVETMFKNIARKSFSDYEEISPVYYDEIDYLLKQGIKSSRTIEREIQRLNRIENYRKEFIGDISHELKTPIFAIQGFIETLLNGALEDEKVNREFLRKAMRNVNRLIYLTKDLMEISKLETGELKSNIEDIYLYEAFHDIMDGLNYKAQKEQIKLVVQDFDKHLKVKADRNQLKQVLINLIENGIKYNVPGGRVTVEVTTTSKKKEKDRVLVSVSDTGIGIDPKDIPRVTERFFRVDKSRSRERGGTGLGLAIVKHIIEAHGEKFTIESAPNKGSTFTISLKKAENNNIFWL